MHDRLHRRDFLRAAALGSGGLGLGRLALRSLLAGETSTGIQTHFPATAKRVIYLFMHGGPSQLDLFDHKPALHKRHGEELPESVRGDQRLTGMTSGQASLPVTSSLFNFQQHGESGAWVSEALPHTASIVDELCFIHFDAHRSDQPRSRGHVDANRSTSRPGRPSLGAWTSYGLGSGKPATCRHSSCHAVGGVAPHVPPIRCTRGCGARGSCPPVTRVSSFRKSAATRCCISPTHRASIAVLRDGGSTGRAWPRLNRRRLQQNRGGS